MNFGGERGIRTPVTVARKPDFESGAFDHSAISPVCEFTIKGGRKERYSQK